MSASSKRSLERLRALRQMGTAKTDETFPPSVMRAVSQNPEADQSADGGAPSPKAGDENASRAPDEQPSTATSSTGYRERLLSVSAVSPTQPIKPYWETVRAIQAVASLPADFVEELEARGFPRPGILTVKGKRLLVADVHEAMSRNRMLVLANADGLDGHAFLSSLPGPRQSCY